jgi:8-oxo-dGTP diphosphatase
LFIKYKTDNILTKIKTFCKIVKIMKYSVYVNPPKDFLSKVEVAGCVCEWEDKILLLKRHPEKPQGNTWGLPSGKLEKNENSQMAVIREVHEEVGLNINSSDLRLIGTLYCRLPHIDYIYYMYRKPFQKFPEVNLAIEEHLEMRWVTVEEGLQLPLIAGGIEALNHYNSIK